MNEEYFYVSPEERVSINDINLLAAYATTLEPVPEATEAFGHATALYNYYQENDNNLKDSYTKLTRNSIGSEFLCTAIQLCLLEKMFRENSITEDMVERYNNVVNNYQKQLRLNREEYVESLGKTM